MSVIELKSLTKDYGNNKGIFNISFNIEKGEIFGFLGPNGAGKTTTIRHLMGFSSPDVGTCTVNGLDCRTEAHKIQKSLGYIPGEIALPEDTTGMGFIKFIAAYRGLKDLTYAKELIDMFELDPSGKIRKMSKGMKQKVGIICAFMHNPDVILLDEPSSGLDPLMQNTFINLVLNHQKQGNTILLSSHIFEEVEKTCSRVSIIRAGHIVTTDTIESLKQSRLHRYNVVLSESPDLFVNELNSADIKVHSIKDNSVTVDISNNLSAFIGILNSHNIISLDSEVQSLEDIFMHYYTTKGGAKND